MAWLGGRKVVDMNASLKRLRLDDSSVVYYDKVCSFSYASPSLVSCLPPWTSSRGRVSGPRNDESHNRDVFLHLSIIYPQCLLATGGAPKNLPVLETAAPEVQVKVSVFRRLYDYANLDGVLLEKNVKDIVVVGGGFLGSELAVALAHRGREHGVRVTQIYREKGNMAKVPQYYPVSWSFSSATTTHFPNVM